MDEGSGVIKSPWSNGANITYTRCNEQDLLHGCLMAWECLVMTVQVVEYALTQMMATMISRFIIHNLFVIPNSQ